MIRQVEDTNSGEETTLYVGGSFERIRGMGRAIDRHHITVAGSAIAVIETNVGSRIATKENYLHKNHQSSVLAITDGNGDVVERRYFDAFGDIKSYIGQAGTYLASYLSYNSVTDLAFTGHRWLASAAVVHMRGRVYDPMIGRFLSADPHIQSPLNSQSLNRYSYVWNNPLSFTDPSGYFLSSLFKGLKKLFKAIGKIIKSVLKAIKKVVKAIGKVLKKIGQFIKKYYKVIIAVVVSVFIPVALASAWGTTVAKFTLGQAIIAGALAGGVSGLITTGSLKGALQGALFGAVTAGFAHKITSGFVSKVGAIKENGIFTAAYKKTLIEAATKSYKITLTVGHAVIGGVRSLVNGGKFLTGAISAGVSKAFTFATNSIDDKLVQGLAVATVGGAVSVLAGGSFELGFLTAGLAYAANHVLTEFSNPVTGSSYNHNNKNIPLKRLSKSQIAEWTEGGELSIDVHSKTVGGVHVYHVLQEVCRGSCDLGNLGETLNSQIAPGQNGPIINGAISDAAGLPGYNPVRSYYDWDDVGGWNVTQPGHLLHPGAVFRDLVQVDQTVYVYTYGVGAGALGLSNNIASQLYWDDINAGVFSGAK